MDLPLLVDETTGNAKILNAITAIENCQIDDMFYPCRPQRGHLTTLFYNFGRLFYKDKIVILEAMRSSIVATLH